MKNLAYTLPCCGADLDAALNFPPHMQDGDTCPLVVLIHGVTAEKDQIQLTTLSDALNDAGYACLRVDMYGHGKSAGRFEDHTLMLWVSEILEIIDHARGLDFVTDVYLAGHSQGGCASVLAAGLKEDHLKGLILLAPGVLLRDLARQGIMFDTHFDPENIPEIIELSSGLRLRSNYVRVNRNLPLEQAVANFRKPVLLVHGTADDLVPLSYSEKLLEDYEDARLTIIPGCGHSFLEDLTSMTDAVVDFLEEMN